MLITNLLSHPNHHLPPKLSHTAHHHRPCSVLHTQCEDTFRLLNPPTTSHEILRTLDGDKKKANMIIMPLHKQKRLPLVVHYDA